MKRKLPANCKGFQKGNKLAVGKGRPSKVIELGAREFILACINGDEGVKAIIASAFKKAKAGSVRHQEILLNYILGRPTESIKLQASGQLNAGSRTVVKIIADQLRLDRLNADAANAPVITEDRIKDMEELLNKEIDESEK